MRATISPEHINVMYDQMTPFQYKALTTVLRISKLTYFEAKEKTIVVVTPEGQYEWETMKKIEELFYDQEIRKYEQNATAGLAEIGAITIVYDRVSEDPIKDEARVAGNGDELIDEFAIYLMLLDLHFVDPVENVEELVDYAGHYIHQLTGKIVLLDKSV